MRLACLIVDRAHALETHSISSSIHVSDSGSVIRIIIAIPFATPNKRIEYRFSFVHCFAEGYLRTSYHAYQPRVTGCPSHYVFEYICIKTMCEDHNGHGDC